jgi:hypothetical protein
MQIVALVNLIERAPGFEDEDVEPDAEVGGDHVHHPDPGQELVLVNVHLETGSTKNLTLVNVHQEIDLTRTCACKCLPGNRFAKKLGLVNVYLETDLY